MQHLLIVSHPQHRSFTQSVTQTCLGAREALITRHLSERSVARHLERVRRAVEDHWGTAPAAQG
ncbi:MAG TPA: hypothetical protein VJ487_16270 [Alphaproteobacteria bacterium]|nr:hypothetical protein [Alphaproteobacteria bacterium]